jgi:hypothetical protein
MKPTSKSLIFPILTTFFAAATPAAVANDILVYKVVETVNWRLHQDPSTSGAVSTASSGRSTYVSYVVRDMTTGMEDTIRTEVRGTSKQFSMSLSTDDNFNTGFPYSYTTDQFWLLDYPRTNLRFQYEAFGATDEPSSSDPLWISLTQHIRGQEKIFRLPLSLKTFKVPTVLSGPGIYYSAGPYELMDADDVVFEEGDEFYNDSSTRTYTLSTTLTDAANRANIVTVGGVNYVGGTMGRGLWEVANVLFRARYAFENEYFAE